MATMILKNGVDMDDDIDTGWVTLATNPQSPARTVTIQTAWEDTADLGGETVDIYITTAKPTDTTKLESLIKSYSVTADVLITNCNAFIVTADITQIKVVYNHDTATAGKFYCTLTSTSTRNNVVGA